jgi:hypothetical protein
MSFPNSVNITQAPALPGDFASANPRHAAPGNVGAWVAGSGGVAVGSFAWGDLTSTDSVVTNAGSGVPTGFVARSFGEAMITTYLAENGLTIPQGFPVPLYVGGDFWVKNTGSSAAAINSKAYASNTTGAVQFAATGQTISGYTETKWYCVGWGGGSGAQNEVVKISSVSLD